MLTISVVLVLTFVGLVMAWQGSWLATGARARSVADLVAIAAARAQQTGQPACDFAEETAAQNSARLTGCEVITGWGEFIVDVTVEVQLPRPISGGPRATRADSRAGVVADAP